MSLNEADLLYEGKAKKVYATGRADEVIVYYKDDATAFNNLKKGTVTDKGVMNNAISAKIYGYLAKHGIPTHLLEVLSDRAQRCKKVQIVPLEVIVRNVLAGSTAKLLGIEEGLVLDTPVFEICYKNDALKDPMINDSHALALKLATREELDRIYELAGRINTLLKEFFDGLGIRLVDFKIEFGRDSSGAIILADEISPDTCRLWDKASNEKLDKDRFRRDLGRVEEAYHEVLSRVLGKE